MDKEVAQIPNELYYSAIKKNEIMPFAAKWVDLETALLSEAKPHREGNVLRHCLYFESKKKKIQMNLFTKQKQTHRLMITSGEGRGRGMVREFGIDRSTLPYLK